jgi:NitT/TauT family transport system permease protein
VSDPLHKWRSRLISLGVFVTCWEIAGRTLDSLLLPTFSETLEAFIRLAGTTELWHAFWVSNQALLIGYAGALIIGVPLGVLMGTLRALERIAGVYFTILLTTPTAALIPLIIIAVGLNLQARALVVFLFAVPFVVINTRVGLSTVDSSLLEMGRSFCASRWQVLRYTIIPAAVPATLLGARIALGRAISGMVLVELLLVAVGLGRLLLVFQGRFMAGDVYAVVLVILLEAVALLKLTRWVERRAAHWTVQPD